MLHALGVLHEQSRSDRDDYITFYADRSNKPGAYTKMPVADWLQMSRDHGGEFELESVMMYGSTATSMNGDPVTTTKSGDKFYGGTRITSMDAMQIQSRYCLKHGHPMKPTGDCITPDAAGVYKKVFADRICDGKSDCPDGEDEDGRMGECIDAQPKTVNGCCSHLVVYGFSCPAVGTFGGRDYYQCEGNVNHVVFKYGIDTWYASTNGLPDRSFGWYGKEVREGAGTCPPEGLWDDGGMQITAHCKSSGFVNLDDCETNKCDENAECIDGISSYKCVCKHEYEGDGFRHGLEIFSKEIIMP